MVCALRTGLRQRKRPWEAWRHVLADRRGAGLPLYMEWSVDDIAEGYRVCVSYAGILCDLGHFRITLVGRKWDYVRCVGLLISAVSR